MFGVTRRALSIAILVGCLGCPVSAEDAKLQKVTMALTASAFHYIAYYLPEYAGFNKEEGITLDVVRVRSGLQEVAAVMGGSVDIAGTGFPHVIDSSHKGGTLVALTTGFDAYPINLVLSNAGLKKAGISEGMSIDERVRRLVGLKLAISAPGASTDMLIRTVMLSRGLDPDKSLTLMPVGSGGAEVAAMEKGAVDGFAYSAPFTSKVVSRGQGRSVVNPLDGDVPEFKNTPYQVVTTSRATVANKRPLLLAWMRAYTKGLKFAAEHPAEAKKILRAAFPEVTDEEYDAAFDAHAKGFPKTPVIAQDQLDQTLKMMNLSEKDKLVVKYSDVVDASVAKEARAAIFNN